MAHDPRDNLDLDDTNADSAALEETVAEVVLEESLDQIDEAETPGAAAVPAIEDDYDPEAGVTNVANKRRASALVHDAVTSEGGRFVIGIAIALVGIGAVILAATMRSRPYYIAAGVIGPPAFIYFFLKWRRWLDSAPYFYRLLTSLGEDADDLLHAHEAKQAEKLRRKLEKEGISQD